jgi:hypothetical protein
MKVFDNEFSNLSFLEPADINNPVALPDYSQDDLLQLEDALLPGTDDASSLKNNGSMYLVPLGEEFENDDASWIMACTFLIYTMQTGIGLIESGFCSMKNEVLKVFSHCTNAVIMVLACRVTRSLKKNRPIFGNVAKTEAKLQKLKLKAENSCITLLLNVKIVQQTVF